MGFIGINEEGNACTHSSDNDINIDPNLNIVSRLDVNEENLYFLVKHMCKELGMVCDVCGAINTTVGYNENIEKKLCASCFERCF